MTLNSLRDIIFIQFLIWLSYSGNDLYDLPDPTYFPASSVIISSLYCCLELLFSFIAWPLHMLSSLLRMIFLPLLIPFILQFLAQLSLLLTVTSSLTFHVWVRSPSSPPCCTVSPVYLSSYPTTSAPHKHQNRTQQTCFYKGPDSKYFRFWKAYGLCFNYSTLLLYHESDRRQYTNKWVCSNITLFTKKQEDVVNRPSFAATLHLIQKYDLRVRNML